MLLLLSAFLFIANPGATVVYAIGPESRAGAIEAAVDYETTLTSLLKKAVTDDGLVRYDLLRGDLNTDFRRVLKAIEDFDTASLRTSAQIKAFWMNAYNVQMLQNIIETPQVENIIDDGFGDAFFNTPFRTAQVAVTLNEIENVILRRQDGDPRLKAFQPDQLDPRLHVALNCAAISCPRLRQQAFTANTLDAELEAAMRDYANGDAHFRAEGSRVILSSLLDWYGPDFDLAGAPAGDFILRYMDTSRPGYDVLKQTLAGQSAAALKGLPSVQYEYLWTVNRAR